MEMQLARKRAWVGGNEERKMDVATQDCKEGRRRAKQVALVYVCTRGRKEEACEEEDATAGERRVTYERPKE